tara:strand:+ start:1714 stop:1845 length:132 start_codon:yes stop_codon:yes gene_type:complete
MSNIHNEQFLETKYEEGLEMGLSEKDAEEYAYKCLEDTPSPYG